MRKHRASRWLQEQREPFLTQSATSGESPKGSTSIVGKTHITPATATTQLSSRGSKATSIVRRAGRASSTATRSSVHFAPSPANCIVEITPYTADTPAAFSPREQSPSALAPVTPAAPAARFYAPGSSRLFDGSPSRPTATPTYASTRSYQPFDVDPWPHCGTMEP